MVTVNLKRVSKTVKKQLVLDELDLVLEPGQISAICTDQPASAAALFNVVNGYKPDEGTVYLDDINAYQERKYLGTVVGGLYAQEDPVKKTVQDFFKGELKHAQGEHLSVAQTLSVAQQLKIDATTRMNDLDVGQQRQLFILSLVAQELPVLLLEQPTIGMTDAQATAIWQLLADYGRKKAATILFYSTQVPEMQRYADQIVYLTNGHVSQIRPLATHDSSDCVVKVTGTGLPVETVDVLGGHFIQETPTYQEFLYTGAIQTLLPLLEQSGITDVRILDATVADELRVW